MKKYLLIALLLISFLCINVKADEETPGVIATDPEVAVIEEEKKEEIKAEVKAEAEPTRAEASVEEEPKTCKVTIIFKEESNTGETINSGNGVQANYSNTISLNDGWNKISRALSKTEFGSGPKYTVDGWYDADGNPVDESMWYNETTPTRIRVGYKCTADSPDEVTLTYILKWNKEIANKYKLVIHDEVSTGSRSWSNTDGHFGSLSHTFATPDARTHYQLVYYKLGEQTFQPGETYTHDITNQGVEDLTEEAYAYWQADVTVNLYSDGKLVSSESSFESVTINDLEDKDYEDFIGWVDENGNEVTERTFYPNEIGTKPEPVEITLYAKYKLVRRDIEVTKVWADDDNESNKRPESVTVTLKADEEEIDEVELSEENSWTHTFEKVNIYNEDNEEINYIVEEKEVPEGYEVSYEGDMEEGFTIHNVLGQGGGEIYDNPQTGSNIVLYLIALIISVTGLFAGKLALRENN